MEETNSRSTNLIQNDDNDENEDEDTVEFRNFHRIRVETIKNTIQNSDFALFLFDKIKPQLFENLVETEFDF